VALGEIIGWFIGWDLLLEYIAIVAVVAIGISGYLAQLFDSSGVVLPTSLFGVLASLFLIYQLPWETWARFGVWLVIGFVSYFAHGRKHSLLDPDSPHHRQRPTPTR
jgi:amino acid transporter